MPPELAFVTVIAWPKGWGWDEVVAAIVEATGIDPADAQQIAPRATPCVVDIDEVAPAKDALRVLHAKRVSSLIVRQSEMDAVRPPLVARRMVAPAGGPAGLYMVEPWRGDGRGLNMVSAVLFVRGRIIKYRRSTNVETHGYYDGPGTLGPMRIDSRVTEMKGGREDALDVYTASGPPVRITGKFDFASVLGREKGYSDGENMDRLAVKLAEQAPGAAIDLSFRDFKPPAGMGRRMVVSAVPGSETVKRDDTPLFDFYSAWMAVMQRAIAQARAARRGSGQS